MSDINIRDIQDIVATLLTSAIEGLPQGASKEELRDAVEKALKGHPDVASLATIENDDSEAGFRVKIELKLVQAPKPNLDLN